MGRSIAEIETALDDSISQAIVNPSGSKYAEWQLWKSIFARAVWVFEQILDVFKADIEAKVKTKQPGSFDWYYDKIMEFQGGNDANGVFQGDVLVVKDGVISYEIPDATRRIIAQCSLSAVDGTLVVKVAKKQDATTFVQLSAAEQVAFSNYLDNIKYPGTQSSVISIAADSIYYNVITYYNPVYTAATVTANVQAKLEEYRQSLGFGDKVYPFSIMNKIAEAEGVVSVKRLSFKGTGATKPQAEIDVVWTLESGYFNYAGNSYLNMTSYKTL